MDLLVHSELWAEIDAINHDQLTFLITGYGNPFTPEGFGNWFKDRCVEASLPRCSAHGLRKAATKTVIEKGHTTAQAGGLTGHKTLTEIDHYSAKRDRAALSDVAVGSLGRAKK
jgi:integrase